MNKTYYRVCNKDTLQGLWYAINGEFTGLIHNDFNFCQNTSLKMDFDTELVGYQQLIRWINSIIGSPKMIFLSYKNMVGISTSLKLNTQNSMKGSNT